MIGMLGESFKPVDTKAAEEDVKVSELKEYSSNISGTLVFSNSGKYVLSAIGNSNVIGMTYPQVDSSFTAGTEVDVDHDPLTHNSSSMDYIPHSHKAKIIKAYLNVNAFPNNSNTSTKGAYIEGPTGRKVIFDKEGLGKSYDITKFVQEEGAGTYWGKNLPVVRRSGNSDLFSNWEIVYVEEDQDLPNNRNVVLYYNGIRQENNISLAIDGNLIGISDHGIPDVGLLLTADGGENSEAWNGSYKETLSIHATHADSSTNKNLPYSDDVHPWDDALNEKISVNGKIPDKINPKYPYANKDIIVNQNVDKKYFLEGKQSINLSLSLTGGLVTPNFYGLSVSLGTPSVNINTHGKESQSKEITIYDKKTIQTTIHMENDISLIDSNVAVTLPKGITYEPSTLKIDGQKENDETYDISKNQLLIPIKEKLPKDMTIEYGIQTTKADKFQNGQISTSVKGNIIYPNGDITSEYQTPENTVDISKEYLIKENYQDENGHSIVPSNNFYIIAKDKYIKKDFPKDISSYLKRSVTYSINHEKEQPVVLPLEYPVDQDLEITYRFKGRPIQFDLIRNGDSLTIDPDELFLDADFMKEIKSLDIVLPEQTKLSQYSAPSSWQKLTAEGSTTFIFNQTVTVTELKDFLSSIQCVANKELPDESAVTINLNKEQIVPRDHEDGTTHYYKFVPGHFNWYQAYNLAKKEQYNGLTGYLMTVTSEEENKFISQRLSIQLGWLGGTRQTFLDGLFISDKTNISEKYKDYTHTTSTWYWADGPEGMKDSEYKQFSEGITSGNPINNSYTNWSYNAPNNVLGSFPIPEGGTVIAPEDCLHWGTAHTTAWNDLSGLAKEKSSAIEGYFIEFSEYDGQKISTEPSKQTISSYTAPVPQPVKIEAYSNKNKRLPDGDLSINRNLKIGQHYNLENQIIKIPNFIVLNDQLPAEISGTIGDKKINGKIFYASASNIVTFYDGKNELTDLKQSVPYGKKLSRPVDPKKEGMVFVRWTTDIEGKQPFDFDQTIIQDELKLYAQWRPIRTTQLVDVSFIDTSKHELASIKDISVKVVDDTKILLSDLKEQKTIKNKLNELLDLKFTLIKEPDATITIDGNNKPKLTFEYKYSQPEQLSITAINSLTFSYQNKELMKPTEIYSTNKKPVTVEVKDTRNPLLTSERGKFQLTVESSHFASSDGKAIKGELSHTDLNSLPGTIYESTNHQLKEDYQVILEESNRQEKGFKLELQPQQLDTGTYKATLTWILSPEV